MPAPDTAAMPATQAPPAPPEMRARRGWSGLFAAWHVWLPLLALLVYTVPHLPYLLPAVQDHGGEVYQPLRALKWGASLGGDFHKYGPTPNLFLLPGYALTLGVWKLTGSFTSPSGDWPYGLTDPMGQMGILILESRLVTLLLGLVAVAVLAASIRTATGSRTAALLAVLVGVVGNYRVVYAMPLPWPDAYMVALLMLTSAAALRVAAHGATPVRSAVMAILAALAVGSKENVGPVLLGLFAGLVVYCWSETRTDPPGRRRLWRSVAVAGVTGMISYLLIAVIYAPRVWLRRMAHWTTGEGVSGGVWGTNDTWAYHLRQFGEALLNNLGPAGIVLIPAAVVAGVVLRPRLTLAFLPATILGVVTVLSLSYIPDRFVTPTTLTLVIPAGIGLGEVVRRWPGARKGVVTFVVLGAAINLWWVGVVFHLRATTEQAMTEYAARADDPAATKALFLMFPDSPGSRRLAHLGHEVDGRPVHAWISGLDDGLPLPQIVYAASGRVQMVDEAADMPARAELYRRDYGFNVDQWPGMEALGYGSPEIVKRPMPRWLPFEWMPLDAELRHTQVLVYRLEGGSGAAAPPPEP